MKLEKIEINSNGDYNLKRDGKIIKHKGIIEVYQVNEDLTDRLNPNIVDMLDNGNFTTKEYIEPVVSLDQIKSNKLYALREKRDDSIDYNGILISISDINRYMYLMIGSDAEIESRLPKKISKDFTLETVKQVKGLAILLNEHNDNYDGKILDCENATTLEEIEAIIV